MRGIRYFYAPRFIFTFIVRVTSLIECANYIRPTIWYHVQTLLRVELLLATDTISSIMQLVYAVLKVSYALYLSLSLHLADQFVHSGLRFDRI